MKKIIIILILLFVVSMQAYAVDIIFTIENTKMQRIIDAMLMLYPNTELKLKVGAVPDPVTGEYKPEDYKLKYTDAQWTKEVIRRWIVSQVQRGEQFKAQKTAVETIQKDQDGLVK